MGPRNTFIAGAAFGLLAASFIAGQNSHAGPATGGPLVRVDESKTSITYANAYRIHTSPEEVVFDFGLSMPNPVATPSSEELVFTVTNRLVMTYPNTKKLSISLSKLVKQYEDRFGNIPAPKTDQP